MEYKRNKIVVGLRGFIPQSVNFSVLDTQQKIEDDAPTTQYGDDGMFVEKMESNFEFEELIVQVLFNLEGDEREIFLYQLLRDFGYQIDHNSFARTLSMERQKYMQVLKTVRNKVMTIAKDYRGENKQLQSSV